MLLARFFSTNAGRSFTVTEPLLYSHLNQVLIEPISGAASRLQELVRCRSAPHAFKGNSGAMLGASLSSPSQRTPTQQHSLAGAQLSVLPCQSRRTQASRALKVTASKQSEPEQQPLHSRIAGPIAAALVASLLVAGAAPTDALAARSGGRAGGSAFRGGGSSMRSAAPRSAPAPRAAPSAPRAAPGYASGHLVATHVWWSHCLAQLDFSPLQHVAHCNEPPDLWVHVSQACTVSL